jgi:hypothetical protein
MAMAATVLEDHVFQATFFEKSRRLLQQHRLLAEDLLTKAEIPIPYFEKG